jgi:hypothetical protein
MRYDNVPIARVKQTVYDSARCGIEADKGFAEHNQSLLLKLS